MEFKQELTGFPMLPSRSAILDSAFVHLTQRGIVLALFSGGHKI